MNCRPGCGACCLAPSISSVIPGMPHGKPAGVACIHLTKALQCGLFDLPQRPPVCESLRPLEEMCGRSREEALVYLTELEKTTAPDCRK